MLPVVLFERAFEPFAVLLFPPVLLKSARLGLVTAALVPALTVAAAPFNKELKGPVNEFAPVSRSTITAPLVVSVVAGKTAV